jgi:hypothetical protein
MQFERSSLFSNILLTTDKNQLQLEPFYLGWMLLTVQPQVPLSVR